ncbi:MAG: NosD domain-containing protein [Candidatus Bathyarchaeia archaeon]|jgi:parallel beta-helix repeat protein
MIHRKILCLFLIVMYLSASSPLFFVAKAGPTIIRVPFDYSTIQAAIDHANPGDTVAVSAGTYYEDLYIDKNLTLTGDNRETTILNGLGGYFGINVNSTSVNITGFTVVNATVGMYLENCGGSTVFGNEVAGSDANITVWEVGIWLYSSNNSVVSDNIVHDDGTYGIVLCGHSSEDTVTLNTINDSGGGLAVSGEGSLICHNNFVNNQNQAVILDSFHNDWNNTREGNYWSDYNGTDANQDGIGDTPYVVDANNTDFYPLMEPYSLHDLGVVSVATSKTGCLPVPTVGLGYSVNVTAEIWNYGTGDENSGLAMYANETLVQPKTNTTLIAGSLASMTVLWNTSGLDYGNYTLMAVVDPVPNETNTSDNTLAGDWIIVTIPGDLNGDFKVSLSDLTLLANAYGSKPGDAKWNPNADMHNSGRVGLTDLTLLAIHYGQHYP